MVSQVRETPEYDGDSHNSENRPAQPFGHRLLVWSWPTYEGWIKFARSKPKYNGHQSHDDLENSSSQGVAFLLQPSEFIMVLDCAWFVAVSWVPEPARTRLGPCNKVPILLRSVQSAQRK